MLSHPIAALLDEHASKATHKNSSDMPLTPQRILSWIRQHHLELNIFHDGKWELDQGAIVWQRRSRQPLHGYAIQDMDGTWVTPVAFIKHKEWRFNSRQSLTEADIIKITPHYLVDSNLASVKIGRETEFIVLPGGLAPHSIQARLDSTGTIATIDLLKITTELAYDHGSDVLQLAKRALASVKTLVREAELQGKSVVPLSFHHKTLTRKDTQENVYVQSTVDKFGWEGKVELFSGSHGTHYHIDNIRLESALVAYNLLQQITPLLAALSLTGPFGYGVGYPNMKKIFESSGVNMSEELASILDADNPLSVRVAARTFGSTGGVNPHVFPPTLEAFFHTAEGQIINGEIMTLDRVGGNHRDLRLRALLGTGELALFDTFAGHPLKEAAMQEFVRVLWWKLQTISPDELCQKHPRLFSAKFLTNVSGYEATTLRCIMLNSLTLSIRGLGTRPGVPTKAYGADGETYSAQDLTKELISFVNQPLHDFAGLPKRVLQHITNCGKVPFRANYAIESDSMHGQHVPSMRGYYKTGLGVPAHWLRARLSALEQSGFSASNALAMCIHDAAQSYHHMIFSMTEKDLIELFER